MARKRRGREGQVNCDKCGRQVRRDKAVYLEKPMFTNPLERKDIIRGQPYTRMLTREVAYCPSCGKHLRIYDKKKKQNARKREREQMRPFRSPSQRRPARIEDERQEAKKPEEGKQQ